MYEWQFDPLKSPKQGMAVDLLHWKGKNKSHLAICFFENARVRYSWGFGSLEKLK